MQRRSLLIAAGSSLAGALAGCIGDDGDESDGGNDSDDSDDAATAGSVDGVDVSRIEVRDGLQFEYSIGADAPQHADGVIAENGRRWVLATVESDRRISRSRFSVATGEDSWAPGFPEGYGEFSSVGGRSGERLDADGGYLAVGVPAPLDASDPRIRYEGQQTGEWPLPEAARERLAAPAPQFELEELQVPDTVTLGHDLEVELTVANVGEGDGTLHVAVYLPQPGNDDEDESGLLAREVAAGETVTESLSIDTTFTRTSPGTVTVALDGHVGGERELFVEVPEDE